MSQPIEWQPVTEERFDFALNVLPPIDRNASGFLLGEPVDHDHATGRPRFHAYRRLTDGGFVASSRPLTRAEWRSITEAA